MALSSLSTGILGVRRTSRAGHGMLSYQARASVVFYPGALVVRRVGSLLAEVPLAASPRNDLILLGTYVGDSKFTASSTADASGGALDDSGVPQSISIRPLSAVGTGDFATGTGANQVTADDVDKPAFLYDDDTYYLTDLDGALSFGGFVEDVTPSGKVIVKHDETMRPLYELYAAGNATAGETEDVTARAVATSLGAFTQSAGVITAAANGALGTQDTISTLAVDDVILLPLGTVGSATVAAADEGPWQIVSLGGASAPYVLRRPAQWAHGYTVRLGSLVKVGGEGATSLYGGTEWKSFAAAGAVVGTNSPALWPGKVTSNVTLASGTLASALATIPVRSATRSEITIASTPTAAPHASTRGHRVSALTAGALGTASIQVVAESAPGTTNASDVGTYNITVNNW